MMVATVLLAGLCALGADGTRHRSEWRANTFSTSAQSEAAIAADADGRSFVVWSSRRQQDGRYGVYGQRFDRDGVALGSEMCLNLWTTSHQLSPAIAMDPGGSAWVVWQSYGQDGSGGSIIARRFDPEGRGGSEVLVNERREGHQSAPVVAVDAVGVALVAWVGAARDGTPEVGARLLGRDGRPRGSEFRLAGAARTPAVAAAPEGGFVVAWSACDAHGRPTAIVAQRVDREGHVLGEPAVVSGTFDRGPVEPAIAGGATGLVVAWHDPQGGGRYATFARRLEGRGCPVGDPIAADDAAGSAQSGAAVLVEPGGGFVVAFNRDEGVHARRFAADGSPCGARFRVTGHSDGRQALRRGVASQRLAAGADGALLCAWSGDGGFGDSSGVGVTMLSPRPPAVVTRGVTGDRTPAATLVARADGPQPHEPPTFDPDRVSDASRELVIGLLGVAFTGIVDTGWNPPDPHLAVGPDHVVLMTNGAIAFFTKDGTQTFIDQIEGAGGFWGSLGATGFVFDPEVLYDPLSERFFAMAAEGFVPGNLSFVLLAVSDDADPNGTWHKYRFETTAVAGDVFDSPNIGVDDEAVYITGDAVGLGSSYAALIFDKASLLAGLPPAVSNMLTIPSATLSAGIPPVSFDDPPALYMCEHGESGVNTSVRLIALQDPLGTPSLTFATLTVPAYGPPEDPPQMGTTTRPETFDARFWSVAYRNGSLWATHHINTDRVLGRWYEISMNGWPDSGDQPQLVQSGEIDPGPGVRTFFTAITVDAHGNAALTCARSAPDEFISMGTAYRYASDPLGTFGAPSIRKVSTGPFARARWGDYAAVNVDPVDTITVWAQHEYAEGGSWRTWVVGDTPLFAAADINLDGVVNVQDLLILLGAWGPCPAPPAPCPGDVDGDGDVDVNDLLLLLGGWG